MTTIAPKGQNVTVSTHSSASIQQNLTQNISGQPQTQTHNQAQALAQALASLHPNQSLTLQVLQQISAQSVQFHSPIGILTLGVPDPSVFTPGANWFLKADIKAESYILTSAQNEKTPETVQNIQAHLVKVVPSNQSGQTAGASQVNLSTMNGETVQSLALKIESVVTAQRHEAATQQNSFAGLYATLARVAEGKISVLQDHADGDVLHKLAQKILALRLPENVTLEHLQQAVRQSGLFHEASLAQDGEFLAAMSQSQDAEETLTANILSILNDQSQDASSDFKTLLTLIKTLTEVHVSEEGKTSGQKSAITVPPPDREGDLSGQRPVIAPHGMESPEDLLSRLAEQSTQGLARLKLLQLASLPGLDQDMRQPETGKIHLNLEIPFVWGQNHTAILALRIQQDGSGMPNEQPEERGWSVDLALDTQETGPLEAQVKLRSDRIGITLWAGEKDFADQLKAGAEHFQARLADQGLDLQTFRILNGKRPQTQKYYGSLTGKYMDQSL